MVFDLLKKEKLSEMEKRFILVYVNLDTAHRKAFVDALEKAADKAAKKADDKAGCEIEYIEIPVSCNLASAGTGFELDISDFSIKTFIKPDENGDFAVEVIGDSMQPDYPDGCFVLIRKYDDCEYPRIGDVALFCVSDDDENGDFQGLIKVWKDDNVLHSINPKYHDKQYPFVKPIGEVRCILEAVHK